MTMTAAPARPSRARDVAVPDPPEPVIPGDLGAVLALERAALGWSQEQLDREAGLARSHTWRLENGTRTLTESVSRRLAEAMRRDGSPVDVAVLDLRLQRAAPDLRRWARRKPYSLRRQRIYAAAVALLDMPRPPDPAERLELARVLAALTLPDPVTLPDPTTLETV